MKSIKDIVEELLNETPLAGKGDWNDGEKRIEVNTIRLDVLKRNYKEIYLTSIEIDKEYEVKWFFDENELHIKIGYIIIEKEVERFKQIGHIQLKRRKDIEKIKKDYNPLYQVEEIVFHKKFRGFGLGKLSYVILLEILKINILSDSVQYDSPRRIYAKLSHFSNVYCDIIDVYEKEIIEENYKIFYKEKDLLYLDDKVWDFNPFSGYDEIGIILYTKK